MIKEIPILFSTSMVQALLEGRKTQTRRLVKPQPIDSVEKDGNLYEGNLNGYVKVDYHPDWPRQFAYQFAKWKKGDLLWVRESFRVNTWVPDDGEVSFRYEADGTASPLMMVDTEDSECENFNRYWEQSCADLLKAGYQTNDDDRFEDYDYKALRLRPNIFLRKEAARIWLQVTDVRVERLQDISEEDARAEGATPRSHRCGGFGYYEAGGDIHDCVCQSWEGDAYVMGFKDLWHEINGAESWQANPWTWVIGFKVLSTTGKPDLNNN